MTNLRQAAQQALEYMRSVGPNDMWPEEWDIAVALEAALAEPEQEPVAWNWMQDGQPYSPAYYGPPPDDDVVRIGLANGRSVRLLYTAPTLRKPVELTDDEIQPLKWYLEVEREYALTGQETLVVNGYLSFARAVIAAYEAKNGITGETK